MFKLSFKAVTLQIATVASVLFSCQAQAKDMITTTTKMILKGSIHPYCKVKINDQREFTLNAIHGEKKSTPITVTSQCNKMETHKIRIRHTSMLTKADAKDSIPFELKNEKGEALPDGIELSSTGQTYRGTFEVFFNLPETVLPGDYAGEVTFEIIAS